MKKRKAHNARRRQDALARALIGTNHAAVVAIDPSGLQQMINWRNRRQIRNELVANALCDLPHRWTIYIAAFCVNEFGERYMKSQEVSPTGMYRASSLSEVIDHFYIELRDGCNPNHRVAMGWLAIPALVMIPEDQAAAVFESVGVWRQVRTPV